MSKVQRALATKKVADELGLAPRLQPKHLRNADAEVGGEDSCQLLRQQQEASYAVSAKPASVRSTRASSPSYFEVLVLIHEARTVPLHEARTVPPNGFF